MAQDRLAINLGGIVRVPLCGARVGICSELLRKVMGWWRDLLLGRCWRDVGDGGRADVAGGQHRMILGARYGVLGERIGTADGTRRHSGRCATAGAVAGAVRLGLGISSSAVAPGGSTVALRGELLWRASGSVTEGSAGGVRHGTGTSANRHFGGTSHHVRLSLG